MDIIQLKIKNRGVCMEKVLAEFLVEWAWPKDFFKALHPDLTQEIIFETYSKHDVCCDKETALLWFKSMEPYFGKNATKLVKAYIKKFREHGQPDVHLRRYTYYIDTSRKEESSGVRQGEASFCEQAIKSAQASTPDILRSAMQDIRDYLGTADQ